MLKPETNNGWFELGRSIQYGLPRNIGIHPVRGEYRRIAVKMGIKTIWAIRAHEFFLWGDPFVVLKGGGKDE